MAAANANPVAAANANLEFVPDGAFTFNSHLYHFTNTFLVEISAGVLLKATALPWFVRKSLRAHARPLWVMAPVPKEKNSGCWARIASPRHF